MMMRNVDTKASTVQSLIYFNLKYTRLCIAEAIFVSVFSETCIDFSTNC